MALVSLFSGCGGMDLGFELAGYNRVFANDNDPDAQAVFRLNLGDIDGRDIRQIDAHEIPDCDILIAGFPCQPFSNAGNRNGVNDRRGTLYLECLRIIEEKRPRVVVFENVKGLLSSRNHDGEPLIDSILGDLNNLQYNSSYRLLRASDFGVPQNRERVFIVAVRGDLGIEFEFPEPVNREGLTIGETIFNIPEEIPNQVSWNLSPQAMYMIERIPEGGSWKSVPYEQLPPRFRRIRDNMQRYHSPNFYRRFSRDEISGTITASAQPENCGIIHPIENRRYTIREIARFQTFPDNFLFIDNSRQNITAMYKVIGNAVPVRLANVIANSIRQQIFRDEEV